MNTVITFSRTPKTHSSMNFDIEKLLCLYSKMSIGSVKYIIHLTYIDWSISTQYFLRGFHEKQVL